MGFQTSYRETYYQRKGIMGNDGATRENLFNTFFQKSIRAEGDPYLIMEDGFKIDSTTIYTAARVGSLLERQLTPDLDIPAKEFNFTIPPPPQPPIIGSVGEVGLTGETGPEGPKGADGIGVDQPAGPAGPAGADGADGQAGATGPTGARGPRGFSGLPGPTGLPGPSPVGPPGLGNGDRVFIINTDPIECAEEDCRPGAACAGILYCDDPDCGPDCD